VLAVLSSAARSPRASFVASSFRDWLLAEAADDARRLRKVFAG